MHDDWLSTGDVAAILGVSRQHVVDLCDRGELICTKVGAHRRIRRRDVARMTKPSVTREQEKSLWLHRALLGALMVDPRGVLQAAKDNIATWKTMHRPDGMTVRYLDQWQGVIEDGVHEVVEVLTGMDEQSSELRQNSPFAGVLPDEERRQVLRAFREHWEREHGPVGTAA
ncbi:helix-turn-helix domain-containing protein [Georgenia halophila]